MADTTIRARPRGPLCVEGCFVVYGSNGEALQIEAGKRVLLCRCGASRSAPLCDGSHNRTGFHPENERE